VTCHGFTDKFAAYSQYSPYLSFATIWPWYHRCPTDDYARVQGEQASPWCAQFRIEVNFRGVSIIMSKIAVGFAATAIGIVG
jgi:hypothetical protein